MLFAKLFLLYRVSVCFATDFFTYAALLTTAAARCIIQKRRDRVCFVPNAALLLKTTPFFAQIAAHASVALAVVPVKIVMAVGAVDIAVYHTINTNPHNIYCGFRGFVGSSRKCGVGLS